MYCKEIELAVLQQSDSISTFETFIAKVNSLCYTFKVDFYFGRWNKQFEIQSLFYMAPFLKIAL